MVKKLKEKINAKVKPKAKAKPKKAKPEITMATVDESKAVEDVYVAPKRVIPRNRS